MNVKLVIIGVRVVIQCRRIRRLDRHGVRRVVVEVVFAVGVVRELRQRRHRNVSLGGDLCDRFEVARVCIIIRVSFAVGQ